MQQNNSYALLRSLQPQMMFNGFIYFQVCYFKCHKIIGGSMSMVRQLKHIAVFAGSACLPDAQC